MKRQIQMHETKYKTIPVKKQTFERLSEYGRKNQTWDDIINELLDIVYSQHLILGGVTHDRKNKNGS